ncbi:UNVERIFIED_CONTAM: Plant UBX domain-containing protein 1 [Sesamum radiatum]|uniref:Plant UBX domain-containing protein 1 n=1 Tax=Sesamum radiatum TaxID=300843 RepID=A0AAW2RBH6_SESRA
MTVDSSPDWKRRRFTAVSPMDSESAKARLAAAKEKYGREIRVFETSAGSATPSNASDIEVTDDFYEFTAEDYYRILATKKEEKYLKTKKIRDAEEAARRSRMTKAVIRVRFPDNHTLEASFHPSETIQSLVDLLNKVVTHPELPFYLCDDGVQFAGPFLQEEVMSLLGLEFVAEQVEPASRPAPEPVVSSPSVVPENKPSEKKKIKPKWLKM